MSIVRHVREFAQQVANSAKGAELPAMPTASSTAMQIINLPLALGGCVAAFVVVSKYPLRKDDTPGEALRRKLGAFVITGAPGIIVAQVAYDVAAHQFPYLSKIPSLSLGVGLILGGCGLPIFLALRERLPATLADSVVSWAQGKMQKPNNQNTFNNPRNSARSDEASNPREEPTEKDQ